jgi:proline dehydrogenase
MLRRVLLYLSEHGGFQRWVPPQLARRFIAGDTLEDALLACERVNHDGITATLDYLGEHVRNLEEAAKCRDAYVRTLEAILERGVKSNVSLKLTQFGIELSDEKCAENVSALLKIAAPAGNFVRIDMESSAYTDRTLRIVETLHHQFGACGTVIQAYLRRSAADIERLCAAGIRVRLCKGAYLEPPTVAFEHKSEVDRNYLELARVLLARGNYPAIATHDQAIINALIAHCRRESIAPERFEFQMLYGIRRDLQRKLIADGYRLRLYIPYGEAWYPYFMRRLAERPANVLFLVRNLIRS